MSVFKTKIANEQMIYNFVKKNLFTLKTSQNEAVAITFDRKSVHFVVYRPDLGSLSIPHLIFTVYMWSNFHTNTCDKIPELGPKCLLDRPDSPRRPISKKGGVLGRATRQLEVKRVRAT